MEEMKARYDELYSKMARSKDVTKMKTFGSADRWAFFMVVDEHPELARKWLDKLEASDWYNYLSESESEEVIASLRDHNGYTGAHWDMDLFCETVLSLGGNVEHHPYYNKQALWVTANMLYSDHEKSAKKYIGNESLMPAYFYDLAVEKLTDVDRPYFIRDYFHLA